jgi:hypothetical protein
VSEKYVPGKSKKLKAESESQSKKPKPQAPRLAEGPALREVKSGKLNAKAAWRKRNLSACVECRYYQMPVL